MWSRRPVLPVERVGQHGGVSTADGDAPPIRRRSPGVPWGRRAGRRLEARADRALAQHLYGGAEELLRQALARSQRSSSADVDTARVARKLGSLQLTLGRREAALRHLTLSYDRLRRSRPVSADMASCLESLATAQRENGRIDEALASSRGALEIRRQIADGAAEMVEAMGRAGLLELGCGEADDAVDTLGRALDLAQGVSPESPLVAGCLRNLAAARLRRGDLDAALSDAQEAVALSTESELGPVTTSECFTVLGHVEVATGELAVALRNFRRALEDTRTVAPRSLVMVHRLINVADAHRLRGELRAALALYTEALALAASVAPGSRQVARCLNYAGFVLRQLGELDVAVTYFARALDIDPSMAEAISNTGSVHLDGGDTELAAHYYAGALETDELSMPPKPASTARDLCYLAIVRPVDGDSLVARAVPLVGEVADPRARAGVLAQLAEVQASRGQYEAALGYVQQALDLDRAAVPGSVEVARELGLLGELQRRAGDLGAAVATLRLAVDIDSVAGARSRAAARHLRDLGAAAEAAGEGALVARCEAEATAIEQALDRQRGVPGPETVPELLAPAGVRVVPAPAPSRLDVVAVSRFAWFATVVGAAAVLVSSLVGPWWRGVAGVRVSELVDDSMLSGTGRAAPLIAVAALVIIASSGASLRRPWAGRKSQFRNWLLVTVILVINVGLLANLVVASSEAAGIVPTGYADVALAGSIVAAAGAVSVLWFRRSAR